MEYGMSEGITRRMSQYVVGMITEVFMSLSVGRALREGDVNVLTAHLFASFVCFFICVLFVGFISVPHIPILLEYISGTELLRLFVDRRNTLEQEL